MNTVTLVNTRNFQEIKLPVNKFKDMFMFEISFVEKELVNSKVYKPVEEEDGTKSPVPFNLILQNWNKFSEAWISDEGVLPYWKIKN